MNKPGWLSGKLADNNSLGLPLGDSFKTASQASYLASSSGRTDRKARQAGGGQAAR